jgi:hypothetical protein
MKGAYLRSFQFPLLPPFDVFDFFIRAQRRIKHFLAFNHVVLEVLISALGCELPTLPPESLLFVGRKTGDKKLVAVRILPRISCFMVERRSESGVLGRCFG